jgi:hypothetical protein
MFRMCLLVLVMAAAAPSMPDLPPGRWDVESKVVEFAAPGVPSVFARMVRGRSKVEHKRLNLGASVETLLAPDPKARCRVESQRIADGRYAQELACPQKDGRSLQVSRSGTYGAFGFVGRAIVTGATGKGMLRIVLDQRAVRTGA